MRTASTLRSATSHSTLRARAGTDSPFSASCGRRVKPMRSRERDASETTPSRLRCAIYTRKSTEEGLDQEFNSLDAQREAAEAFIQSQRREGWIALPELYDDGGFTGANMDRPALGRLLRAVEAGELDCVVVYKVDRLSRSTRPTPTCARGRTSSCSWMRHTARQAGIWATIWWRPSRTRPCWGSPARQSTRLHTARARSRSSARMTTRGI